MAKTTSAVDSLRISRSIDSVLNAMGTSAAIAFSESLKNKYGLEVNDITTKKLVYVEAVLRLMFGQGGNVLIRLLHYELER